MGALSVPGVPAVTSLALIMAAGIFAEAGVQLTEYVKSSERSLKAFEKSSLSTPGLDPDSEAFEAGNAVSKPLGASSTPKPNCTSQPADPPSRVLAFTAFKTSGADTAVRSSF